MHDTTASMHQQVPCTRKNDIQGSRLIAYAVNSLQLWPDKCDVIITSSSNFYTVSIYRSLGIFTAIFAIFV